jgi:protein O-mannosyl-transferase
MAGRNGGVLAHHAIQPVPLIGWRRWEFAAAIVALAVASSWNGVANDFTYDDRFIVFGNDALHQLENWWRFFGMPYWPAKWGGDGYRPITILAFSLEWVAGHGRPWLFHAANIALYAAVSGAVFFLAECCLPISAAAIAAALFAVSPLHVEAVAGVVGQSELIAALCILTAVTIYVRGRNASLLGPGRMAAITVLYAFACLTKEHGIVLPALLVAAELTIVVDSEPLRRRLVELRPLFLGLCAVALGYLWAHSLASGQELTGFQQYAAFSSMRVHSTGRALTMFGLAPEWLRLFFWPVHLSSEYGPPAYPVVTGFHVYQIPGMLLVGSILALGVALRRRSPALSFGIWFTVIALLPTSNFIVPAGILLAERTLFLPSVGAMIVAGSILSFAYRRATMRPLRIAAIAALQAALLLGAWRSYQRTKVWKDNGTLFDHAVLDAPGVYRSHYMRGIWKFDQKQMVEGEREMRIAMSLYEADPYVYFELGQQYLNAHEYRAAATLFRRSLQCDSTFTVGRGRLAVALAELNEWPEAQRQALIALSETTRPSPAVRAVLKLATSEMNRDRAKHVGAKVTGPTPHD